MECTVKIEYCTVTAGNQSRSIHIQYTFFSPFPYAGKQSCPKLQCEALQILAPPDPSFSQMIQLPLFLTILGVSLYCALSYLTRMINYIFDKSESSKYSSELDDFLRSMNRTIEIKQLNLDLIFPHFQSRFRVLWDKTLPQRQNKGIYSVAQSQLNHYPRTTRIKI